jgi:hypothetical protein
MSGSVVDGYIGKLVDGFVLYDVQQSICCIADMKRLRHALDGFYLLQDGAHNGTG